MKPNVVVIVATIKALKYHGGVAKEDILKPNDEALKNGMHNLYKHIYNMKNEFGLNVIVAINKFNTDTDTEIEFVKNDLTKKMYPIKCS